MTSVIAEIGINHNGDILKAFKLIDAAIDAGCDYVKFKKRTPALAVPKSQWDKPKETPWGQMSYIEYKEKLEFSKSDYRNLHLYCKGNIGWFASCWDVPSVDFIASLNVPYIKIPSACLTDDKLLEHARDTKIPIILSTGMSTVEEIHHAVMTLKSSLYCVFHCTSTYPAKPEELNLNMIPTLKEWYERWGIKVGYSGHEVGLGTTLAAVALGAEMVERHITLDRSMWGTDQSASVEPQGMKKLVRDIRTLEKALGDGVKRVYDSEIPIKEKLRA